MKNLTKMKKKCDIILFDYINFNEFYTKDFELVMK